MLSIASIINYQAPQDRAPEKVYITMETFSLLQPLMDRAIAYQWSELENAEQRTNQAIYLLSKAHDISYGLENEMNAIRNGISQMEIKQEELSRVVEQIQALEVEISSVKTRYHDLLSSQSLLSNEHMEEQTLLQTFFNTIKNTSSTIQLSDKDPANSIKKYYEHSIDALNAHCKTWDAINEEINLSSEVFQKNPSDLNLFQCYSHAVDKMVNYNITKGRLNENAKHTKLLYDKFEKINAAIDEKKYKLEFIDKQVKSCYKEIVEKEDTLSAINEQANAINIELQTFKRYEFQKYLQNVNCRLEISNINYFRAESSVFDCMDVEANILSRKTTLKRERDLLMSLTEESSELVFQGPPDEESSKFERPQTAESSDLVFQEPPAKRNKIR